MISATGVILLGSFVRRRLAATLIVTGLALPCSLMSIPSATASAATPDVSSAAAANEVSLQWNMSVRKNAVRDPASGLTLSLEGSWKPLSGSVRFGAKARQGLGVENDLGRLSPKESDFAVVANFTTTTVPAGEGYSPNVVQKGRYGTGGQWKMQVHASKKWGTLAECRFEGDQGSVIVRDGTNTRLDDGSSHVVACWRQGSELGVTIDGRITAIGQNVGDINPRSGITVGNKSASGGAEDQLDGSISCLVAAIGRNSLDRALSRSGC